MTTKLDTMCYEVYHPENINKPTRFETLREAYQAKHERDATTPGHLVRRRRPKGCKRILEGLLAERDLGHLKVWYRARRPQGWMVDEHGSHLSMQRIGYCFVQAVDMIRGGTLDYMFGGKKRERPTKRTLRESREGS